MEKIRIFISLLVAATSNCSLYSKDHPSVDELTKKAAETADVLLREAGRLEIMQVENKFVINQTPVHALALQGSKLVNRLRRKGVTYVKFLPGITVNELKEFVNQLVETDKKMPAFPHIETGVLDVKIGEDNMDTNFDSDDMAGFVSRQAEMTKNVYDDIAKAKTPNIAMLYEIMENFIAALDRRSNVLQLLSDAKSRNEYTYIHATNVAALSMFQMDSLGIKERDILCDIGIAGLLHDVGKLFISSATLEKKGALNAEEWEEMKLHPFYGAKYLYPVEGLPRLATVVAFMHHFRQDGQGYPALRTVSIGHHICSQIVTIADVFDALRSIRPYRRDLQTKEVLLIMKNDSGRAFNPALLSNFTHKVGEALSASL